MCQSSSKNKSARFYSRNLVYSLILIMLHKLLDDIIKRLRIFDQSGNISEHYPRFGPVGNGSDSRFKVKFFFLLIQRSNPLISVKNINFRNRMNDQISYFI